MAEPVLCQCGAVLVESVDDKGVTLIGGEYIPFRRNTDYVVCPSCHSVYKVGELGGDRDPAKGETQTDDEIIERLERLATGEGPPPASQP